MNCPLCGTPDDLQPIDDDQDTLDSLNAGYERWRARALAAETRLRRAERRWCHAEQVRQAWKYASNTQA
jgi:hypothetical protein